MKTLTTIFAATVLLTSCTQTKEQYSCETQLTTKSESQCVCQFITKTKADRKCVKSKKGLTIMNLKIN